MIRDLFDFHHGACGMNTEIERLRGVLVSVRDSFTVADVGGKPTISGDINPTVYDLVCAAIASPQPTPIDDATREQLQARLKELDAAAAAIGAMMQPYKTALAAIDAARYGLLDQHGIVEIAGTCECGRLLFNGDRGHQCDDGPLLCEACSPTWADVKRSWEEDEAAVASFGREAFFDEDHADRMKAFAQSYEAHVAAGGSPDDKVTYVLE